MIVHDAVRVDALRAGPHLVPDDFERQAEQLAARLASDGYAVVEGGAAGASLLSQAALAVAAWMRGLGEPRWRELEAASEEATPYGRGALGRAWRTPGNGSGLELTMAHRRLPWVPPGVGAVAAEACGPGSGAMLAADELARALLAALVRSPQVGAPSAGAFLSLLDDLPLARQTAGSSALAVRAERPYAPGGREPTSLPCSDERMLLMLARPGAPFADQHGALELKLRGGTTPAVLQLDAHQALLLPGEALVRATGGALGGRAAVEEVRATWVGEGTPDPQTSLVLVTYKLRTREGAALDPAPLLLQGAGRSGAANSGAAAGLRVPPSNDLGVGAGAAPCPRGLRAAGTHANRDALGTPALAVESGGADARATAAAGGAGGKGAGPSKRRVTIAVRHSGDSSLSGNFQVWSTWPMSRLVDAYMERSALTRKQVTMANCWGDCIDEGHTIGDFAAAGDGTVYVWPVENGQQQQQQQQQEQPLPPPQSQQQQQPRASPPAPAGGSLAQWLREEVEGQAEAEADQEDAGPDGRDGSYDEARAAGIDGDGGSGSNGEGTEKGDDEEHDAGPSRKRQRTSSLVQRGGPQPAAAAKAPRCGAVGSNGGGGGSSSQPERLTLSVRLPTGQVLSVAMRPTQAFGRVRGVVASKMGLKPSEQERVVLMHPRSGGRVLRPSDTPEALGLIGGDELEAVLDP